MRRSLPGELVGTIEAAHEAPGLIASLLTPDDDPTTLERDAAVRLLDAVLRDELASTDLDRTLGALEAALGPTVRDLNLYPPPQLQRSGAPARCEARRPEPRVETGRGSHGTRSSGQPGMKAISTLLLFPLRPLRPCGFLSSHPRGPTNSVFAPTEPSDERR